MPQQRINVLLHVVIARAAPEFSGAFIVMIERRRSDLGQFLAWLCHGKSGVISDPALNRLGGVGGCCVEADPGRGCPHMHQIEQFLKKQQAFRSA